MQCCSHNHLVFRLLLLTISVSLFKWHDIVALGLKQNTLALSCSVEFLQ